MHRVWREVSKLDLSNHEGHLWIQLCFDHRDEINIIGTGNFKIFSKAGDEMRQSKNVTLSLEKPKRVVYFSQDLPPLTTIKIFDGDNKMLFHMISEDPVEIK